MSKSSREQERFLAAGGALCRPSFGDIDTARLQELVSADDWAPVRFRRSVALLVPLMLHNAKLADVELEGTIFDEIPEKLKRNPHELLLTYHARFRALTGVFYQFARAGIEDVLLLKGAAISPRWSFPALRPMSDADIVLKPEDLPKAEAALETAGWLRGTSCWVSRRGWQLDILVADTKTARAIWRRSKRSLYWNNLALSPTGTQPGSQPGTGDTPPDEEKGFSLNIMEPDDPDHLFYLAGHSVRHGGARLWHDLADFHLLLVNGNRPEVAIESIRRWRDTAGVGDLAGLLRLYNRLASPEQKAIGGQGLLPAEQERRALFCVKTMPQFILSDLTATEISAVESFARPKSLGLLRQAKRAVSPKKEKIHALQGQADETGGLPLSDSAFEDDLLTQGFVGRQASKIGLFIRLIRQGNLGKTIRAARTFARIKSAERSFTPTYPDEQRNVGTAPKTLIEEPVT